MGLKSYIRQKLYNVVRAAVKEELAENSAANDCASGGEKNNDAKEEIIQRLDKQIERWTWERFQRIQKEIEIREWELNKDIDRKINNSQLEILCEIDKIMKQYSTDAFIEKVDRRLVVRLGDKMKQFEEIVKRWTWERYLRIQKKEELLNYILNDVADISFNSKKQFLKSGEKLRVVFLYQLASLWPSWESLYLACKNDNRFDVKVLFLNELVAGKERLKTSELFLDDNNIEYENFEKFDIAEYQPHVLILQTPYDYSQRIMAHWSARIKSLGIRIVYIPYGIEITDMEESHDEQYNTDTMMNCWRIYTFSDMIKYEYAKYSMNGGAVKALGLPKFDSLYTKEKFPISNVVKEKANGRKIVLWKLHFPKAYKKNGVETLVTPDFNVYIEFAKHLHDFKDLFFVFMPHPLFKETCGDATRQQQALKVFEIVETTDNVYVDTADDYRYSLFNADYIIIDRSAVMVEAAAVGVPILFMSNPNFLEPKPAAITPLIESYYQGTTVDDMLNYLDMCRMGNDPKKGEREMAFKMCIPYFDGKCGERIKEDIIGGLTEETNRS